MNKFSLLLNKSHNLNNTHCLQLYTYIHIMDGYIVLYNSI